MSLDQDNAYTRIMHWLQYGEMPVHGLLGWAGTGKTYLLQRIANDIGEDNVWVMCYTGKAASVLRNRGFLEATTIHRRLYRPFDPAPEQRADLCVQLRTTQDPEQRQLLLEQLAALPSIVYNNPNETIFDKGRPQLLVIDEASMIDDRIGTDLINLGVKILVVGDPFQLPPVRTSRGFFDRMEMPKAHLTENHRQEEGGDILEMARLIREDGVLQTMGTAANVVDHVPNGWFYNYDQMLCGLNRTRHRYNAVARWFSFGRAAEDPPATDDRIVCLRNDYEAGWLNGTTWKVQETWAVEDSAFIGASIQSLAGDNAQIQVNLDAGHFHGQGYPDELWNFGSALTVHKAQGSEWDNVIVVDESGAFNRGSDGREMKHRWLYTAVTRAVKQVTVVRYPYRR